MFLEWRNKVEEKKEGRKEESESKKRKVSRKSRKKRNKKIFFIVLLVLLFCIVCGNVIRIDTVNIVGNEIFTAEEIKRDLFLGQETKSFCDILIEVLTKKETKIPYLSEYHISFENYHTITVTVQEKEILGCIDYGGVYVYIDIKGMVLDFDEEKWEGTSTLEGIYVTKAVLHEIIETNDLDKLKFLQKLQILLKQHKIVADSLYYSPKGIFIMDIGTIRVFFGDTSNLEEKVNVFVSMLPSLEGLSGTLYLNEYSPQSSITGYRFEVSQ